MTLVKFISLVLIIVLESCNQVNNKIENITLPDSSIDTSASTFLDSVLNKEDLSWEQMRSNTIIDSAYYNPNAVFTGDTVYNINKRRIAVIQYKTGVVCEYKFIFIFQSVPLRNTGFKLFQTSCDIGPAEEGLVSSSFTIMNDAILVKEVSNKKVNGKSVKHVTSVKTYKISASGKIEGNDS